MTAESCTGGGLAYFISKNPICSPILERAYVAYSYSAKEDLLSVKKRTLNLYGAVSKQTALEMAEGALKNSTAHISIAITGFDADANEKSDYGIVWIACAGINMKSYVTHYNYKGSRGAFMEKVVLDAMHELLNFINK